jgi:hypothetical protein
VHQKSELPNTDFARGHRFGFEVIDGHPHTKNLARINRWVNLDSLTKLAVIIAYTHPPYAHSVPACPNQSSRDSEELSSTAASSSGEESDDSQPVLKAPARWLQDISTSQK